MRTANRDKRWMLMCMAIGESLQDAKVIVGQMSLNNNEKIIFVILNSMPFAEKRDMHSEFNMIKSTVQTKLVNLQQSECVQSGQTDLPTCVCVCVCVCVYRNVYNILFPPSLHYLLSPTR
jgi:hypothetical protein